MPLPKDIIKNNSELSIYDKGELTPKCIVEQLSKLRDAFPEISLEFTKVLTERIRKNGFNNNRLIDAISNVIDNFNYKIPNVSTIISFDKRVKLFKHADVCATFDDGYTFNDFCKIRISGQLFWIKKTEKEQYNILDEY